MCMFSLVKKIQVMGRSIKWEVTFPVPLLHCSINTPENWHLTFPASHSVVLGSPWAGGPPWAWHPSATGPWGAEAAAAVLGSTVGPALSRPTPACQQPCGLCSTHLWPSPPGSRLCLGLDLLFSFIREFTLPRVQFGGCWSCSLCKWAGYNSLYSTAITLAYN